MRIVTLLPSATEVVAALGLGEELVGISHECDYPANVVANKPIVTRSAIPQGLTPAEIDRLVAERIHRGESLYTLDLELLEQLKPDLILTQELCEVCAVSAPIVREAICQLSTTPQLISLEPTNLAEIFNTLRIVADAAGVPERAAQVIEQLYTRLARLDVRWRETRIKPRGLPLEWLMPPFSAGIGLLKWCSTRAVSLCSLRPANVLRGSIGKRSFNRDQMLCFSCRAATASR